MNNYKLRTTSFGSPIFNKFVQSLKPSKTRSDDSSETVLTLVEVLLKKECRQSSDIYCIFLKNVDITSHIQRIKHYILSLLFPNEPSSDCLTQ